MIARFFTIPHKQQSQTQERFLILPSRISQAKMGLSEKPACVLRIGNHFRKKPHEHVTGTYLWLCPHRFLTAIELGGYFCDHAGLSLPCTTLPPQCQHRSCRQRIKTKLLYHPRARRRCQWKSRSCIDTTIRLFKTHNSEKLGHQETTRVVDILSRLSIPLCAHMSLDQTPIHDFRKLPHGDCLNTNGVIESIVRSSAKTWKKPEERSGHTVRCVQCPRGTSVQISIILEEDQTLAQHSTHKIENVTACDQEIWSEMSWVSLKIRRYLDMSRLSDSTNLEITGRRLSIFEGTFEDLEENFSKQHLTGSEAAGHGYGFPGQRDSLTSLNDADPSHLDKDASYVLHSPTCSHTC